MGGFFPLADAHAKIGLARLETDLCSQEGKSLPIHEYAIMVAIVATKHTLRQCGGRSTVVTLRTVFYFYAEVIPVTFAA